MSNCVLRLPAIFSDNMVFQRNVPAPVWGWAAPGAQVAVAFDGQSVSAKSGGDGKWMATLAPLTAGGPHELTVQSGRDTVTVRNVLVGEVWLCSGQSNMEMYVADSINAEQELAKANYPDIRIIRVPKVISHQPQPDVNAAWKICNRDNVATFSAVAYFFGREIHKKLGVPVGLIDSSWGGTIIEAWTSLGALKTQPENVATLQRYASALKNLDKARAEYAAQLAQWEKDCYHEDPGNEGEAKGWSSPEHDDSAWPTMTLPTSWEATGMNIDGSVWFRKTVQIAPAMAGKELTLNLGVADDYDTTYFNGVKIGWIGKETLNPWSVQRQYKLPASLVRPGRNVIAVRVFDRFGSGGLMGPAGVMSVSDGANALPLAGPWKYQVELALEPKPVKPMPMAVPSLEDPNQLAVLYNAMIAPLAPFAIAGATWYQGESNASAAYRYRRSFPLMIEDWRRQWDRDFMFLFVELANFTAPQANPIELQTWPELREAQLMALRLPAVGVGTAVDIGDAGDIHPKNKQEVGRRLALWALANEYGLKLVCSGPLYRSMKVEDGAICISFDHVGGGLCAIPRATRPSGTKLHALQGFAIAGADRKWFWADARIDGKTVVCSSPQVPIPVAVRYGWGDNPMLSLYNKEGLPASPFRTDNWPGVTEKM
jgi:sialate O-acetylesterase